MKAESDWVVPPVFATGTKGTGIGSCAKETKSEKLKAKSESIFFFMFHFMIAIQHVCGTTDWMAILFYFYGF